MTNKKTNDTEDVAGTEDVVFDESSYLKNTSNNLDVILRRTGWTQKRLAKEMDVSQAMMVDYVRGDRFPSIQSILRLVRSKEIQRQIPFTIDQFLTGDVRDNEVHFGSDFTWNQEENTHTDILGNYSLYFFEQKMQDVGVAPQMRKLRYGMLSLYETARKSGGLKVLSFARFFKLEEEAKAFRLELENISAPAEERLEKEITLYRSHDDTYTGAVALIGNHIFIDLFSTLYNDKGLIILTAPEKKPGADYIGGLGNIVSITHGAEHVPVAQKIILARGIVEASDEEIATHLLYGSVKIEVDGETQALLNLLEAFYSSGESGSGLDRILDTADKRAIIRQRLQQLINNYINRTFNGLCMVSKQDDHACYRFLKRHTKQ